MKVLFFLVVFHFVTAGQWKIPTSEDYIGCFADNPGRQLAGEVKVIRGDLTPNSCQYYCAKKGYRLAGLEVGNECFCGDYLDGDTRLEDSTCARPCGGDKRQMCGNDWALSVYRTNVKGYNAVKANYVGCYVDNAQRFLNGTPFSPFSLQTPQYCVDFCRTRGFSFSGTEVGRECYCGNSLDNGTVVDDKGCQRPCLGDKNLVCGDSWRLSVYTTMLTGYNSVKANYMGCYVDSAERFLNGTPFNTSDLQTPQYCIDFCRTRGFSYSGTEVGQECFCGDSVENGTVVADKECKRPCAGDRDLVCGDSWRLSIYRTLASGKSDNPVSSSYKGCYRDQGKRWLNGLRKMTLSLTPFLCYTLCRKQGFSLAGLQSGTLCLCGDWVKEEDRVTDSECSRPCAGDLSLNCGGNEDSYTSVYQTDMNSMPSSALVGCYRDSGESRLLGGAVAESESMTVEQCVGFCYRRGFIFAGLHIGEQCFCGNGLAGAESLPNSMCSAPCGGNREQTCGAYLKLTVYQTGITYAQISESGGPAYMGCFVDTKERQLYGAERNMPLLQSPDTCLSFCYKNGFQLAGLQAGSQCFCGDKFKEGSLTEDKDCSSNCPGDPSQKCGGGWRLSVHSTRLRGRRLKSHLVGCFEDGGPQPLLVGDARESAAMTIDSCFGFCYRSGYRFAGVKNRYKCFCGNDLQGKKPIGNYNCGKDCLGSSRVKCGGTSTITVYNTGVQVRLNAVLGSCEGSESRSQGKQPCKEQLLFKEDFDRNYLDEGKWSRIVRVPTGSDDQFAEFTNRSSNAFVKEAKLYIQPTVTAVGEGGSKHSLPPPSERIPGRIMSGRVDTRHSFTFRYGKVQVRAKLPLGDWLVPELWLKPVGAEPGEQKGTLRVGMARGNARLKKDTHDIGNTQLELGVLLGPSESDFQNRNVIDFFNSDGWHKEFHNFTLIWKPDNLYFAVDDSVEVPLISEIDVRSGDGLNFFNRYSQWSRGSDITPFNKEFFLSFGVSVGGWDFPDDYVSGDGIKKPWKNGDPMAIYNFWSDKKNWLPTWKDGESALQVDSVTVTAL